MIKSKKKLPERHLSEKAKKSGAVLFATALFERALEKWSEGLRSNSDIFFQGRNLKNKCLASSYMGASITVITEPEHQWLVLTPELDQAEAIKQEHARTARLSPPVEINPADVEEYNQKGGE